MTQTSTATQISVIGLGPMGRSMTDILLDQGLRLTVWNRTPSRCRHAVEKGAIHAQSLRSALAASPMILLSLTDYRVMYDLLQPEADLLDGRSIANLSSDTPDQARQATLWAKRLGADFLVGAPMFDPPLIGQPDAYAFYGGESAVFAQWQPLLQRFSRCDYLGSDPGLALLYNQALLGILFGSAVSVLHGMALVRSAGRSAKSFEPYAESFVRLLPHFFQGMADEADSGRYAGDQNNLRMMAAAMGHVTAASREARVQAAFPSVLQSIFQQALAKGHGEDGLTSLIEVLQKPDP